MSKAVLEKQAPDLAVFRARLREGRSTFRFHVALLGLKSFDPLALLDRIHQGLPFSALERFQRNTSLSTKELTDLLRISPRTLVRRKEEGRLQPEESDRLVRASRIFGRALELFEGNPDAALAWLRSPQRALGGAAPLSVAGTDAGAQEVERLAGRLEHGIPT